MSKELDEWLKHMSPDTLELNKELVVGRITDTGGSPEEFKDMAKTKRKNKFNAVKTEVDGTMFDSKKEARRYVILRDMQERERISRLALQPKFILQEKFVTPMGDKIRAITYTADFLYSVTDEYGVSKDIIEDVKGGTATQTQEFKLKWKMLLYVYRDKPSYEFRIVA